MISLISVPASNVYVPSLPYHECSVLLGSTGLSLHAKRHARQGIEHDNGFRCFYL
jgi:hypothetical protein